MMLTLFQTKNIIQTFNYITYYNHSIRKNFYGYVKFYAWLDNLELINNFSIYLCLDEIVLKKLLKDTCAVRYYKDHVEYITINYLSLNDMHYAQRAVISTNCTLS